MTKLISIDRRVEQFTGKYKLEFRLEIDGRPYVTVERYQHAEDAAERELVAKYCPDLIVKKM